MAPWQAQAAADVACEAGWLLALVKISFECDLKNQKMPYSLYSSSNSKSCPTKVGKTESTRRTDCFIKANVFNCMPIWHKGKFLKLDSVPTNVLD